MSNLTKVLIVEYSLIILGTIAVFWIMKDEDKWK